MRIVLALAVAALAGAAHAQPACDAFAAQIEDIQKDMADRKWAGIRDNSAFRANVRATEDQAALTQIGLVMEQMKAANCPVYSAPITADRYFPAARRCGRDLESKGIFGKTPKSCDRASWQPIG